MMTLSWIDNTRFQTIFDFITRNTNSILILVYSPFSFQTLISTLLSSIFLVFFPIGEELFKIFWNIYEWKWFWTSRTLTRNMFDRIILWLMLTETWKLQIFWKRKIKIRLWKCCRSIYGTEVRRTSTLLSPFTYSRDIWTDNIVNLSTIRE